MFNTFTFSLYLLLSLLLATATCLPTIGVTYSTTTVTTAQSPTPPPPPQDRITTAMKNLTLTSLRDLGMYRFRPEISLGMELFQGRPFNFRDNFTTGVRYRNFFDGYETIPEIYLRGLVKHLKSGGGTPLLKDVKSESINNLLPTITIHVSLRDLGIGKISVSYPFPPSSATFQEPPGANLIGPLFSDSNSSFLINLYPYNMYRLRPRRFQEHPFNFRDDFTTGVRYRYLFDIMVDDVVSSMAFVGYETIPVIVTETGWPSAGNNLDANSGYAEFYLRGLVKHLNSGAGTPLLKDGVKAVYLYELFDKDGTGSSKYLIIFSEASRSCLMNWINVALILALTMVVQAMDLDHLVGDEALSHAEEEDEVMEMMELDAADIMMGRFYEIDHSKLPLIPQDARRERFLERAQLRRIRVVKVYHICDGLVHISYPTFRQVGCKFGYYSAFFSKLHGFITEVHGGGIHTPYFGKSIHLSMEEARRALKMIPDEEVKDKMCLMEFYVIKTLF